jgi:magnesium-transporting ATPase (P-type)
MQRRQSRAASDRNKNWSVIGDPTDGALFVVALKYGQVVDEIIEEKPTTTSCHSALNENA